MYLTRPRYTTKVGRLV